MAMTHDLVLVDVACRIEEAGSLRKLAERWGISPAYLSDVMRKRRNPGPAILKHLGLVSVRKVIVRYEPKGKKA